MELNNLIELVQENGTTLSKKVLKDAIAFAKKSGSAELAYELACVVEGKERQDMEQIVLRAKEPKFCYLFAKDIPGADVKAHEQVILNQRDVKYAVEFASDIPNIDLYKLFDIVICSKNPEYAYKFALEVDITEKLEKSLLKDLTLSTKVSKKLNLDKYTDAKIANETYKSEIHRLALDKTKKIIDILQQIVIDSNDSTYIELFKRDIDGADTKKLSLAKSRIVKACKTVKVDKELTK